MYQGTVAGVTNLVEERDNDLTAELFVAPIARISVLVGKVIGAAIAAMVALVGIFGMAVLMQIPLDAGDVLRVLAFTPILALAGGALGVLIVGITQDPKVVAAAIPLVVLPQLFLSGAIIPVGATDGFLGLVARLIPMTYSVDLARNIFYAGKPEYALAVLNPLWLDAAVTVGFCVLFVVVGTWLFVRSDRER
jgi:ABC-2 type transport system permease protein